MEAIKFSSYIRLWIDTEKLVSDRYELKFQVRYHMPSVYILMCRGEYLEAFDSILEATEAAYKHQMIKGLV